MSYFCGNCDDDFSDDVTCPECVAGLRARLSAAEKERDEAKASCAALREWVTDIRDSLLTPLALMHGAFGAVAEGFGSSTVALLSAPNPGAGWVSPEEAAKHEGELDDLMAECEEVRSAIGATIAKLKAERHVFGMAVAERARAEMKRCQPHEHCEARMNATDLSALVAEVEASHG